MIKRNTKNRIHFSCPSHESAPIPQRLLTYGLLGVLGLALVLRIWGIGFGLPYDFTPDEVHEIIRALKLGAGEYSWTPGKGGLYLILFIEYGALFGFWWLTGQIDTPTDFALMYLQDPTAFYLSGRITVAIMGAFTCLVVYWIGNRLYSWKVGLAAAAIGAMAHYHAVWSHYINVDIGMTLAIWLSILAYLKYEETTNVRWLLATGAFAGVAFAFKFPGIVVVVPLLLAVASKERGRSARRHQIRDFGLIVLATLITATVVVPENVLQVGAVTRQFSKLISNNDADQKPQTESHEADDEFDAAVFDVTIMHNDDYVSLLLKKTYIVLTISVLVGAAFGIWRRNRWDTIWIIFFIVFLGVMSLADRPALQRYMLPVIPAMWLLGARGAATIAGNRNSLFLIVLAAIVAVPLFALVRDNYMFTRPDTRVVAKEWIETNAPPDAKILMDGMRYRFTQSPPLVPNDIAVSRRVDRAKKSDRKLSRGVSDRTLELYAKAMSQIDGPKYDLHSTIWGLGVEELSYYYDHCFDYIVTSSVNARRYVGEAAERKYPVSARFYGGLAADPRFEAVFSSTSKDWEIQGPTIEVYEVLHTCGDDLG